MIKVNYCFDGAFVNNSSFANLLLKNYRCAAVKRSYFS